jgi:enoyl-CoA hydratase/carnithine racemase
VAFFGHEEAGATAIVRFDRKANLNAFNEKLINCVKCWHI